MLNLILLTTALIQPPNNAEIQSHDLTHHSFNSIRNQLITENNNTQAHHSLLNDINASLPMEIKASLDAEFAHMLIQLNEEVTYKINTNTSQLYTQKIR